MNVLRRGDDGIELDQHLPGIALEQSRGPLRRVRASGQRRHREHAREQRAGRAADAVDAEHVERIVIAEPQLQRRAGPEANCAGDEADDDAMPGQHEARCWRDGAETGDGARDHAEHRWFSARRPFQEHPGQRAG